jgi:hypothetical protein
MRSIVKGLRNRGTACSFRGWRRDAHFMALFQGQRRGCYGSLKRRLLGLINILGLAVMADTPAVPKIS